MGRLTQQKSLPSNSVPRSNRKDLLWSKIKSAIDQQFPLPVEKQCLQVLSDCPWMFSIRWGRFGPLFGVTKPRFGGVGPRRLVRTKACPVRMSTDLGGVPAIRRRRARCTMAGGNQDRVVWNRGRVPHQRGLRTTAGSDPPETPASSESPAYSQGTGDRDRSGVPDRTPGSSAC